LLCGMADPTAALAFSHQTLATSNSRAWLRLTLEHRIQHNSDERRSRSAMDATEERQEPSSYRKETILACGRSCIAEVPRRSCPGSEHPLAMARRYRPSANVSRWNLRGHNRNHCHTSRVEIADNMTPLPFHIHLTLYIMPRDLWKRQMEASL